MAKCRGCGEDTREYKSPGLGWMHWKCEVERLASLLEESEANIDCLERELAEAKAEGERLRYAAFKFGRVEGRRERDAEWKSALRVAVKGGKIQTLDEARAEGRSEMRDVMQRVLDKLDKDGMKPGWGVVRDWLRRALQTR